MPGRREIIDVIASDAALNFREPRLNFIGLAGGQSTQPLHDFPMLSILQSTQVARYVSEVDKFTGRQYGVDGAYVVHHVAVAYGACSATVVSGHPANCGTARGRYINRKVHTVGFQLTIEVLEHDARLHGHG